MSNEKTTDKFIQLLAREVIATGINHISYSLEDTFLLRQHLCRPLKPNPNERDNQDIAELVILTRSLINGRNEDAAAMADNFRKARELLAALLPCEDLYDNESSLDFHHHGDLLYEISRLLASPVNVVTARIISHNQAIQLAA